MTARLFTSPPSCFAMARRMARTWFWQGFYGESTARGNTDKSMLTGIHNMGNAMPESTRKVHTCMFTTMYNMGKSIHTGVHKMQKPMLTTIYNITTHNMSSICD